MIFPYVLLKGKYLPIVPLELKGKEWIEVRAFVDTGASYSIFHSDIAEILGLDYKSGKKRLPHCWRWLSYARIQT